MAHRTAFALLALGAAGLVGACSYSAQLGDEVARLLEDDANEDIVLEQIDVQPEDLEDVAVSCPDDVGTDRGDEATCVATIGGADFEVLVTFTADEEFEITDISPA